MPAGRHRPQKARQTRKLWHTLQATWSGLSSPPGQFKGAIYRHGGRHEAQSVVAPNVTTKHTNSAQVRRINQPALDATRIAVRTAMADTVKSISSSMSKEQRALLQREHFWQRTNERSNWMQGETGSPQRDSFHYTFGARTEDCVLFFFPRDTTCAGKKRSVETWRRGILLYEIVGSCHPCSADRRRGVCTQPVSRGHFHRPQRLHIPIRGSRTGRVI